MGTIFGIIALVFLFVLTFGMNKAHREATGINMPSTNAWRRIRRNAKKKGIGEQQAYDQWLTRKQKFERVAPTVPVSVNHSAAAEARMTTDRERPFKYFYQLNDCLDIRLTEFVRTPGTTIWNFNCNFRCRKCGSNEWDNTEDALDTSVITCQSCGTELGLFGAIKSAARSYGETKLREHWHTQAASRIINEDKGINRVVYDVTSEPPGTIELERE